MRRLRQSLAFIAVVASLAFAVPPVLAAPQPGASCKVAGRERVTTAGMLRCTSSTTRGLRWRLVSASQTTTPSSTTPATTTTAPASSAVAPRVSNVVANDNDVRFTLSGMSPDTNNYAVQWVLRGNSFTDYQMIRSTSKSISISAQTFRCDRTYTFRVFAMRTDWTLSQGHTNQNVTPHSDTFDITMSHPCVNTAIRPLACAVGGPCAVGDTGPGGGVVFYVSDSTFACGLSQASTCKYLEAAPANWNGAGGDPNRSWSTDTDAGAGLGNQTTAVSGADGTAIGTGYQNSVDVSNQYGNVAATSAAVTARSYTGGSKYDWHLPSKDELNELYLKQSTVGGFADDTYWSSSESTASKAWRQNLTLSNRFTYDKFDVSRVRPIRAFGTSSSWIQLGSDFDGEAAADRSGNSVAISANGNIIAIGAQVNDGGGSNAGHVRVFEWSAGLWSQRGADIDGSAVGGLLGAAVDLSNDGSVVVASAPYEDSYKGVTRVFDWSGSVWTPRPTITGEATFDEATAVSLSGDGSVLAIGSPFNDGGGSNSGSVRVFVWNGTSWTQRGSDIDGEAAGDQSGGKISLSSDGTTLAVGAMRNAGGGSGRGHVRVFAWNGSAWVQRGADLEGSSDVDLFGTSVSLSADGSILAVGISGVDTGPGVDEGQVQVFSWNGSAWSQRGSSLDGDVTNERLGSDVSLSSDGSVLVVAAYQNSTMGSAAGRTKFYRWSGSAYEQSGPSLYGEAASDEFGGSVRVSRDGSTVIAGGRDNDGTGSNAGHARVYRYS